ncbi:MAG: DUF4345 domain-containing protein [Cyclobacteriaceae bacterium]
MKTLFPKILLGLLGIAFCKTGIETLINPHAVLAQVGIVLDNASALSSMRAVYGGMHLVFGLFCFYGIFRNPQAPLVLVILYTTGFVLGRLSGIIVDGAPNAFVMTWLITEVVSGTLAAGALVLANKAVLKPQYI